MIAALLGMGNQGNNAAQNSYNQSSDLWGNVLSQGSQAFGNWWGNRNPTQGAQRDFTQPPPPTMTPTNPYQGVFPPASQNPFSGANLY
jgi:hypothetical protein